MFGFRGLMNIIKAPYNALKQEIKRLKGRIAFLQEEEKLLGDEASDRKYLEKELLEKYQEELKETLNDMSACGCLPALLALEEINREEIEAEETAAVEGNNRKKIAGINSHKNCLLQEAGVERDLKVMQKLVSYFNEQLKKLDNKQDILGSYDKDNNVLTITEDSTLWLLTSQLFSMLDKRCEDALKKRASNNPDAETTLTVPVMRNMIYEREIKVFFDGVNEIVENLFLDNKTIQIKVSPGIDHQLLPESLKNRMKPEPNSVEEASSEKMTNQSRNKYCNIM